MSELKLKYDKANENSVAKNEKEPGRSEENVLYDTEGNVRNLCLVQADGKRIFLNYAYLISGELFPEKNIIVLSFSTHIVTLEGNLLEEMYEALVHHKPRTIRVLDERYVNIQEKSNGLIINIKITPQ